MVRRVLATAVVALFTFSNVLFAHVPERSFWDERRANRTGSTALAQAIAPPKPLPFLSTRLDSPALPLNDFKDLAAAVQRHATVRRVTEPANPRGRVLLIQDVHLHLEAQRKIAAILSAIHPGVVGVEGAWGAFDFERFDRFGTPADRRAVLESLFEAGRVSAPAYAAARAPMNLVGMDDPVLYEENLAAYRASVPTADGVASRIAAASRRIDAKKPGVFNAALLAFDAAVTAYRRNESHLGPFIAELDSRGLLSALRSADRTALRNFRRAAEMESRIDFDAVERERRILFERLALKIEDVDLEALGRATLSYHRGELTVGRYFAFLQTHFDRFGVDLDAWAAFRAYLQYVALSDKLDPSLILGAVERAIDVGYQNLATNDGEKRLVAASRYLPLAERLSRFSLTPEEWAAYRELKARAGLDFALETHEAFYRVADERSAAMAENLIAALEAGGDAGTTAALVIGGFHEPDLAEAIADRGYAVMSVSPKLTAVPTAGGASYLSVFDREKSGLEKLFSGRVLHLYPAQANLGAVIPRADVINRIYAVGSEASDVLRGADVANVPYDGETYQAALGPIPDGYEAIEGAVIDLEGGSIRFVRPVGLRFSLASPRRALSDARAWLTRAVRSNPRMAVAAALVAGILLLAAAAPLAGTAAAVPLSLGIAVGAVVVTRSLSGPIARLREMFLDIDGLFGGSPDRPASDPVMIRSDEGLELAVRVEAALGDRQGVESSRVLFRDEQTGKAVGTAALFVTDDRHISIEVAAEREYRSYESALWDFMIRRTDEWLRNVLAIDHVTRALRENLSIDVLRNDPGRFKAGDRFVNPVLKAVERDGWDTVLNVSLYEIGRANVAPRAFRIRLSPSGTVAAEWIRPESGNEYEQADVARVQGDVEALFARRLGDARTAAGMASHSTVFVTAPSNVDSESLLRVSEGLRAPLPVNGTEEPLRIEAARENGGVAISASKRFNGFALPAGTAMVEVGVSGYTNRAEWIIQPSAEALIPRLIRYFVRAGIQGRRNAENGKTNGAGDVREGDEPGGTQPGALGFWRDIKLGGFVEGLVSVYILRVAIKAIVANSNLLDPIAGLPGSTSLAFATLGAVGAGFFAASVLLHFFMGIRQPDGTVLDRSNTPALALLTKAAAAATSSSVVLLLLPAVVVAAKSAETGVGGPYGLALFGGLLHLLVNVYVTKSWDAAIRRLPPEDVIPSTLHRRAERIRRHLTIQPGSLRAERTRWGIRFSFDVTTLRPDVIRNADFYVHLINPDGSETELKVPGTRLSKRTGTAATYRATTTYMPKQRGDFEATVFAAPRAAPVSTTSPLNMWYGERADNIAFSSYGWPEAVSDYLQPGLSAAWSGRGLSIRSAAWIQHALVTGGATALLTGATLASLGNEAGIQRVVVLAGTFGLVELVALPLVLFLIYFFGGVAPIGPDQRSRVRPAVGATAATFPALLSVFLITPAVLFGFFGATPYASFSIALGGLGFFFGGVLFEAVNRRVAILRETMSTAPVGEVSLTDEERKILIENGREILPFVSEEAVVPDSDRSRFRPLAAGFQGDPSPHAIGVFGSSYRSVARYAAWVHENVLGGKKDVPIVFTGGHGHRTPEWWESEAEIFAETFVQEIYRLRRKKIADQWDDGWLGHPLMLPIRTLVLMILPRILGGVPEIHLDREATNTGENVQNFVQILHQRYGVAESDDFPVKTALLLTGTLFLKRVNQTWTFQSQRDWTFATAAGAAMRYDENVPNGELLLKAFELHYQIVKLEEYAGTHTDKAAFLEKYLAAAKRMEPVLKAHGPAIKELDATRSDLEQSTEIEILLSYLGLKGPLRFLVTASRILNERNQPPRRDWERRPVAPGGAWGIWARAPRLGYGLKGAFEGVGLVAVQFITQAAALVAAGGPRNLPAFIGVEGWLAPAGAAGLLTIVGIAAGYAVIRLFHRVWGVLLPDNVSISHDRRDAASADRIASLSLMAAPVIAAALLSANPLSATVFAVLALLAGVGPHAAANRARADRVRRKRIAGRLLAELAVTPAFELSLQAYGLTPSGLQSEIETALLRDRRSALFLEALLDGLAERNESVDAALIGPRHEASIESADLTLLVPAPDIDAASAAVSRAYASEKGENQRIAVAVTDEAMGEALLKRWPDLLVMPLYDWDGESAFHKLVAASEHLSGPIGSVNVFIDSRAAMSDTFLAALRHFERGSRVVRIYYALALERALAVAVRVTADSLIETKARLARLIAIMA